MNDAAVAAVSERARVFRAVTVFGLVALAVCALLAARESWPPARALVLARDSGWVALWALCATLVTTPLARIARALTRGTGRSLVPPVGVLRRALGMAAAWLACVHAAGALAFSLHWDWAALRDWPHLRAGLCALALLVLLFATSFRRVVVALRLRFFKELHRLAYLAALFAVGHVLLGPFASRTFALSLCGGVLLVGLGRFLGVKSERSSV